MAFDDGDEFDGEDAKGLRKELGKLGKSNKDMAERLAKYEAKDLITTKGFTTVKPEELVSIAEDEREAHAKALHEERQGMQRDLLRQALKGQYPDDDETLEEMVNELLGEKAQTSAEGQQVERARELGHIDSKPAPLIDTRNLHTEAAIAASFESKK